MGHINLNKLKAMKSKGVVIGVPTFKEKEIEGVCEACQLGVVQLITDCITESHQSTNVSE